MIVLLSCSMSLSANSETGYHHSSTGEGENLKDSVLIAYDDLRIVNSKLIQLKYEQQSNSKLRNIVRNDSIIIRDYKVLNEQISKDCKKAIRQRNIAFGIAGVFFLTSLLLFMK